MEGIRDGRALDGCYYCTLLYPDVHPCPECAGAMRYEPASDESAGDEALTDALDRFASERSRLALEELLSLIHLAGDEGEATLQRDGRFSLDDLRRAFETLSPR